MEENVEFKVIGNIGELSLSQRDVNSLKIDFRCMSDSEFELFFSILGTNRIILARFAFHCSNEENKDFDLRYLKEQSNLKLSLWKTLHLPFNINHFAVSNQNLWTLGENFYVDINSHLKSIFQDQESALQTEEDLMDIDSSDEVLLQECETTIEITSFQKYKPLNENFFINSHLFDESIIICSRDAISMTWQLDLIMPSQDLPFSDEHSKIFPLINFPITYNESSGNLPTSGNDKF